MAKNIESKTIAAALSTALAVSMFVVPMANAEENPFGMTELSSGFMVADAEGKCGEGKCGGDQDSEGKDSEGKDSEGKDSEGKCGEGKCGS